MLLDRILADMATQAGVERCGLLLGDQGHIADFRPAANVHPAPARHFELDPAALIAALREERSGGLAVIGHVHSHPGETAEPSRVDAAAADGDGRLWLIVGQDGPRLWRSMAGGAHLGAFDPVRLVICDETPTASSSAACHRSPPPYSARAAWR